MAVLERGLRDFLCAGIPHSGGAIASATRETAEALLGWIQLDCNKEPVEAFTKEVVKALDSVLPEQRSSQASREKMWGAYHSLRTSPTFTSVWRRFLEAANVVPLPLFYQSLTDTLFQGRIELHFTISCTPEQGDGEAERKCTQLRGGKCNPLCGQRLSERTFFMHMYINSNRTCHSWSTCYCQLFIIKIV
jgi:hypothetical protein